MILKSAQIENYRCIEDSTEFSIDPVTCLVGKNESGKSALLKALYTLNPVNETQSEFSQIYDYPRRHWADYTERHEKDPDNVLTTEWELTPIEIKELGETFGEESITGKNVTITKGYNNARYWVTPVSEKKTAAFLLKKADLHQEEKEKLKDQGSIADFINVLEGEEERSEREEAFLNHLKKTYKKGKASLCAIDILEKHFPKFLLFSSYYTLEGQVSIESLLNRIKNKTSSDHDMVFQALLALAKTTVEKINKIDKFEELTAQLEAVSGRIGREIFEYWSQNEHLKVVFKFDSGKPGDPPPFNSGYVFRTRIHNTRHDATVNFDERSTGFIWFFSFLIWFSQVKRNYGDNIVILLDEPALNLHPRAQADLLRYIDEKLKPHHQVIYTTHSPFMIDPKNILSARTVEDVFKGKKVEGTKVGDKVLSTDSDTVSPLQAALGYDITQTLFVGKNNLLVEGPSDLIYLQWFSEELRQRGRECLNPKWTIAPTGGIDKVNSFVTLFRGNKLNVAVLTDFHSGDKNKIRNLRESNLIKDGHVLTADAYCDQDEADIEDMIGRDFYVALVNGCYNFKEKTLLPGKKPADASLRVIEEVETHFRTLPPPVPDFSHYAPAPFLLRNAGEVGKSLPKLDEALDRFEALFKDINKLL
ncbi:MAG: AAA family ATPase [Planctomycetota bacterium]